MLTSLRVSDYALIENVEVEFQQGLNVLTGETGAGKTVLVGAIGLLLGDRADSMLVRHGARAASFSAAFDVSGLPGTAARLIEEGSLLDGETELFLTRTVSSDGRSRCTINGRLCPVSALSAAGASLVEVHGQNTHQALLNVSAHAGYLDRYAGQEHLGDLDLYSRTYAELRGLLAERRETTGGSGELETDARFLEHEIAAIDSASPEPGEIEGLEAEAGRMRHSRELWEASSRIVRALAGQEENTARDLLEAAAAEARAMSVRDGSLAGLAGRLESAALEVEDIAAEISRYGDSLPTDAGALERAEARLSVLRELCRRFGGSLEAVLEYRAEADARLERIRGKLRGAETVTAEIESRFRSLSEVDARLKAARRESSRSLAKAVMRELAQLEMPGARFEVSIEGRGADPETGSFGPAGSQTVEFLFSPVADGPMRPLAKIASGGEMSRVMLAVKIVLAAADRLPVLVFDEVDSGIGGETAARVGEKLRQLARLHQVFCVTHLPQIASSADRQYAVFKSEEDGSATTGIRLLDEDGRVDEICRMLGDSSGRKVTRAHARDMLRRAGDGPPSSVR